jgi:hypothetical protein
MSDTQVTFYAVLKRLADKDDRGLKYSPLDNITNMQVVHKGRDTHITIGFPGDVLNPIYHGKLIGGFILCDREAYEKAKNELLVEVRP